MSPRVTFEKFESISGEWDDAQVSIIVIGGNDWGEIVKEWTPETPLTQYEIKSYDVSLYVADIDQDDTGEHFDRSFEVRDYPNAHAALMAARRWVRDVVESYFED